MMYENFNDFLDSIEKVELKDLPSIFNKALQKDDNYEILFRFMLQRGFILLHGDSFIKSNEEDFNRESYLFKCDNPDSVCQELEDLLDENFHENEFKIDVLHTPFGRECACYSVLGNGKVVIEYPNFTKNQKVWANSKDKEQNPSKHI